MRTLDVESITQVTPEKPKVKKTRRKSKMAETMSIAPKPEAPPTTPNEEITLMIGDVSKEFPILVDSD